ncbi:hypothetical protein [Mycobacterium sp. GA-2829]|uniref:hypothetical protein n=1 Tax=Mycobacterium sp. GA-2829 TaxID=1772283 RepID=UPI00074024AE|nr:hypothetical protein [Mycobacterium sp. GA-2829]KUI26442.1 hypothetical protein AU194_30800 [Mycobacterium sp. GA-2829]
MPDELLRHVIGPTPYSTWWLWVAIVLLVIVIAWYVLVFVATLPSEKLRGRRVVGPLHAKVLRHRYARRITAVTDGHAAGRLTDADAYAALARTLRSFLHQATGVRAQYMQLDALADSVAAPAVPVLAEITDIRFAGARGDVGALAARAQELVRTWT